MKKQITQRIPAIFGFIAGMAVYFLIKHLFLSDIESDLVRILSSIGIIVFVAIICTLIDNHMARRTERDS